MAENKQIEIEGHHKAVKMGLGDAIQRLLKVDALYANGISNVPEEMLSERDLIVEALNNQFELNLGFDCNDDDVPDTVAIFQQTAHTSCCRILPTEIQKQVSKRTSRRSGAQKKRPQEDVEERVRKHSGLVKTTAHQQPVVEAPTPPPAHSPPLRQEIPVRIFRGLKKILPEPIPA